MMGNKVEHICVISSVHSALDTRIFHKQAKSLAKAGYKVTLIAQHDKNEVVDGVKIVALPKPRNRFRRILGTWRVFKLALKQKADAYHFHDPELLLVGLLLKLVTKGKVIYDVHEDYSKAILTKHWLPSLIRKPLAYIFKLMEKWAASRFDYIIAATDDISTKFRGRDNVAIIKNYPILEKIEPAPKSVSGQPTLIYIGGLSQVRGISEIVQAMTYLASSRNARLVLYGKFNPEGYQKIVQGLDGFDRVEYRGWLKPEQVWQEMVKADVGVVCFHPVPNAIKAMPNKLFEYMAGGIPVIASNFPLWREIVEGNNCGLTVNPLDPEDIAKAIEYLLDNPDQARQMGQNGRKAAREKYNWEIESKRLLDLYQDLD